MAQNSSRKRNKPLKANKRESENVEAVVREINTIKRPKLKALLLAAVWFVVGLALGGILYAINRRALSENYMTSFLIIVAIGILWSLLKFGLADRTQLKLHNTRIVRELKHLKVEPRKWTLSASDFRNYKKQKSWLGPIVLCAVSAIAASVAAIITFV